VIRHIVSRPLSVVVATFAFTAFGALALFKLPVSLLPRIERSSLVVTAKASHVSRDELLQQVTSPIERCLALVPGVSSVESETRDGESRITVTPAWQTDADRLRIDVTRRIEGAARIPLDDLSVETETDPAPIIEIAITGASGSERSRIADRVVLPEIARIDGAGRIDVAGATPLRVTVRPRAADLEARGLTAADVEQRLRAIGTSVNAGRVREGAAVRPLVVTESVRTPDELAQMTIRDVPLGEVAGIALQEVSDDTAFRLLDRSTGTATDGVLLRVYRAPNANAVALARGVRERAAELAKRLANVRVTVVIDRSGEVSRALADLGLAVLLGVLLGTVILRWMIGHWRPTLALAVVIPAALLASFTAFFAAGIPLDVISLSGLALATGLLVDNSIVVLDSIESAREAGEGDAVAAGTRRVLVAVIASSVTLMIVFAPMLFLRGLARAIFGEQAIAVVISICASVILSITLTPVLAQRERRSVGARYPGREVCMAMLDRAMRRPFAALAIGVVVVLVGVSAGMFLPRELFARGAERDVVIEVRTPPDLKPETARQRIAAVWSAAIAAVDRREVSAMWMTRASAERPATIDIELVSSRAADVALRHLRARMATLEGAPAVRLRASTFVEAVSGRADRIEIIPTATTDAEAQTLAGRIIDAMRQSGFRLADDASESTRRLALALRWDEQRLGATHTERATVEDDVRAAAGNIDVGRADVTGAEAAIRLLQTTPENVSLTPAHVGGSIVPLSAVAAVTLTERSPALLRDERRPARRLLFEGADIAAATRAVGALSTGGSERIRVAGRARDLVEAFAQMRLTLFLAIVLLYLTVAAFYESLLLPLAVLAAVPFAMAGAFAALLLTGQSLNIMSLVGLVFLGGLVVNHTVVLLDRAEHLRNDGVPEDAAIRTAAADRYRPVIMTTIVAVAGMLPLAIFGGAGVELRRSIAVVVVGGLVTATAGTLILIPLLHRALEPFRRRSRVNRLATNHA
jgi:HAE1 family hydrophobic/amphiphilic exporter-1